MRFDPGFKPSELILMRTSRPTWKSSGRTIITGWHLYRLGTGETAEPNSYGTRHVSANDEYHDGKWSGKAKDEIDISKITARFENTLEGVQVYEKVVALEQLQIGVEKMVQDAMNAAIDGQSLARVQEITNLTRAFTLRGCGGFYDSAEEKFLQDTKDHFDILLVAAALDSGNEKLDDIPF